MPKVSPPEFHENYPKRLIGFDEWPGDAMLDKHEVCFLAKRSPSSISRDVKAGRLDPPIKIGPNTIRWTARVIRRYLKGGK